MGSWACPAHPGRTAVRPRAGSRCPQSHSRHAVAVPTSNWAALKSAGAGRVGRWGAPHCRSRARRTNAPLPGPSTASLLPGTTERRAGPVPGARVGLATAVTVNMGERDAQKLRKKTFVVVWFELPRHRPPSFFFRSRSTAGTYELHVSKQDFLFLGVVSCACCCCCCVGNEKKRQRRERGGCRFKMTKQVCAAKKGGMTAKNRAQQGGVSFVASRSERKKTIVGGMCVQVWFVELISPAQKAKKVDQMMQKKAARCVGRGTPEGREERRLRSGGGAARRLGLAGRNLRRQ